MPSQDIYVYIFFHFQFNGAHLFHLTDYSGQNQSINTEHPCNAKSPNLKQESLDIKDKAILPLRGFSYGPLNEAGQKFSIKIGKLICKANFTYEESLSVKTNFQSLKRRLKIKTPVLQLISILYGQKIQALHHK